MSFRAMTFGTLRQIRKPDARKRFDEGKPIVLCGSNMRPGAPWHPEYPLGPDSIAEWKRHAAFYGPDGITPSDQLWHGDVNSTAWHLMLNHYGANLSPEEGRYPVFYVDSEEA